MAELGTTNDPRALVPGDPAAIHQAARSMTGYAGDLHEAGYGLRTLMTPAGWSGDAADRFRASCELQPPKWSEAGDCFTDAGRALDIYAETLTGAQRQAAEAIRVWNEGQAATATARADYDHRAGQPRPPGSPPLAAFVDPGEAQRRHAREILDQARQQLDAAGNTAADTVGAARDRAPEQKGFWSTVGDTLGDIGSSALDAGKDLVNGLASVGNAALDHPGDVAAMLGGAGLVVLGAGGELGGGALDLTGAGAVVGVPVNVASTGVIASGVGIAGAGALHMAQSAAGEDRVSPLETGGSSGPRTAPGPKPAAERPPTQNAKLSNVVDDLYKGTKTPGRTGDGTTADAVRN